jgi:antitoxin ParD1/3/4
MPSVTVSLSEYLKRFVEGEVAAKGYASVSEYIGLLVQMAYLEKHRDRVEQLLLEGINSGPATPMTPQDWKDIQREGLARLAKEKQHTGKRPKKPRRPKRPA